MSSQPAATPAARQADPSRAAREHAFQHLLSRLNQLEGGELLECSASYSKIKELGRGGQGVVYQAERLDQFAAWRALKIFSPQPYGDVESYDEDMERMLQVALAVHRNPHDDLLDVEYFGRHKNIYVMLMQLIDGYDLWRLLQPDLLNRLKASVSDRRWRGLKNVVYSVRGPGQVGLQPAIAVYIIERCLRGLEALHGMGVVHGDIKPSNIMLNASGGVKLIDIGSAFELDSPSRWPTATPRYAAPEFLETGKLTPQSDLASLGYVLIELLSGKSLISAAYAGVPSTKTLRHAGRRDLLEAKHALPQQLFNILPERVRDSEVLLALCSRLIAPDLKERFASAGDVIENPEGSFAFQRELMYGDLAVSNFQEMRRWLVDVKGARGKAVAHEGP